MNRLITIRFSHYNEKARWALDRFRVPYVEEGYMPGLHMAAVLRLAPRHGLGKADRISTPLSTPILITDDGLCLRDSSHIVRHVSDRFAKAGEDLYFDPEAAALEERFALELGPHTRRFAYFHAFTDPTSLATMADANVSATQARWFRRLYPFLQRFIASRLRVTPEKAERSLQKARAIMNEVSARIEGRRFLVGDRFSAADLAFATMAAPLLLPSPEEGYGAVFPPVELLPPAFAEVRSEMRASPAGQLALRLFREERGVRQIPL